MERKIVSINQPAYLPWLGYFHRISISDVHIVLDHVQFEKNSVTNRNKIRTKEGWCWLTVPLKSNKRFDELIISDLEIADNQNWRKKHRDSIFQNYRKSTYFNQHSDFFEKLYTSEWDKLISLNKVILNYILEILYIETSIFYSSDLGVGSKKNDLILDLCKKVGANYYLSGIFGKNYLNEDEFYKNGIFVGYQEYIHPEYDQVYPGFEPYMSIIDLLFNHGKDAFRILMSNNDVTRQII